MQSLRRLAESNGFSTLICLAETSVNICRTKWRARILQNYATLNVCPTMFGRFPSLKLTQDKMDPMHCVTLVNTWTAQTNRILLWSNAMRKVEWGLSIPMGNLLDYVSYVKSCTRGACTTQSTKREFGPCFGLPVPGYIWHLVASSKHASPHHCIALFY